MQCSGATNPKLDHGHTKIRAIQQEAEMYRKSPDGIRAQQPLFACAVFELGPGLANVRQDVALCLCYRPARVRLPESVGFRV